MLTTVFVATDFACEPNINIVATARRYTHVHRTFQLVGPDAELDRIARATIKIGLEELTNAFSPRR